MPPSSAPAQVPKERFGLLFWVLVGCTIITVIITVLMMYRMSQKPSPPSSAPGVVMPSKPALQKQQEAFVENTLPAAVTVEPLTVPATAGGPPAAAAPEGLSMVYVYSKSCGWCDRFNPTWQDFTDRYAGPLTVLKVEARDPGAKKYNVAAYPTVLIVRPDGSTLATFNDDRTVENLLRFAAGYA